MAEVKINPLVVSQSIGKFLQDSAITAQATWGRPEKFDPNAPNMDQWFQSHVTALQQDVGRLTTGLYFDGTFLVECFAKTQAGLLAHLNMATACQDVLCQQLIPIRDYQEAGDPIIGYARMKEPVLKDRGLSGPYQKATLSIRFRVDQTA